MPALSKRTETFTDSVIRRMTRISNKYAEKIFTSIPSPGARRISVKRLRESSRT